MTPGPDTDLAELERLEKGAVFYFTPEFPKSPHLENAVRVQVVNISRDPSGVVLGVRYDPEQPMIVRETIAHLIFGDSAVWERVRESRNKPMPMLKGMGYVFTLAFTSVAHVMRMIANEPARRKRAEERERKVAIVEEHPAHILAFGEAFDPVLKRTCSPDEADAQPIPTHDGRGGPHRRGD